MQTRLWRAAASFALGTVGLGGLALAANRSRQLKDDRILNPNQQPYLDFAEKERRAGKSQFAPWVTTDQHDLALAQRYFPQFPVSEPSSAGQFNNKPVEVLSLAKANQELDSLPHCLSRVTGYGLYEYLRVRSGQPLKYQMAQTQEPLFVAVGGVSAALAAYQRAKEGMPVLYVSNLQAEAGLATEEVTAYLSGKERLGLMQTQIQAFVNPPRYDKEVLRPEFSGFNLKLAAWLKNPGEWLTGLQVVWGNDRLAKQKDQASLRFAEQQERNRQSSETLEQINQDLKILREPRGALIVARTKQAQQELLSLKQEGHELSPLNSQQVEEKYGFYPRRAQRLMEIKPAFIMEPQALGLITEGIKAQGGTVLTNWRISRVLVDTHRNQGGILEFEELTEAGETQVHLRQFSLAHLDLGTRPFSPNPYPQVKLTSVSINALLMHAKLIGGPVYFGGTLVPLTAAKRVDVGDKTKGNCMDITDLSFVRLSGGGSVGPLGEAGSSYDGRQAVNLIETAETTLPCAATLKILSVTGSDSVVGVEGRSLEVHPLVKAGHKKVPVETVTIQMGAGKVLSQNSSVLFSPKASAKKAEGAMKAEQKNVVEEWKKYTPH